jgi:uncharacterized protein involved in exopolysaccharide biosynthesis/Mrp family chromosome partitioning ATPase
MLQWSLRGPIMTVMSTRFEAPGHIRVVNAANEPVLGEAVASFDPWAIVQGLRRRLPLIGATTLATLALALGFVALSPSRYTASTQILIDPRGLKIIDNDITRSGTGDTDLVQAESQREIIQSRSVLEKVIDKAELETNPLFGARPPGLRTRLMGLVGLGAEPADPFAAALATLQKSITTHRDDRSFVIDIGVTTEDPETSQLVANTIAQVYIAEEARVRADATRRASDALAARLSELRNSVKSAEARVEEYKKEHRIIGIDGGRADEQELRELNSQLMAARAQVGDLQSRVDQIREVQARGLDMGVFPETLQANTITTLKDQYAALKRQEAQLGQSLLPQHPAMKALRAQADQVRALIRAEIARVATGTAGNLERAKATAQDLESRVAALKSNVLTTNEASVTLRELEREADSTRAVYETFLQRTKELSEQQSVDSSNARIITKALVPRDRSNPSPILVIAAGLLLGAGLGTSLAWALDQVDDRFRDLRQIATASGLPLLASIPAAWRTSPPSRFNFRGSNRSSSTLKAIERIPVTKPFLLGQLAFALESLLPLSDTRTIVIVTPDGGEVRSKVAIDLAVTFTQDGERTLLVDGDARSRQLSTLVTNGGGTAENVVTPLPNGASLRVLPVPANASGQMARSQRTELDEAIAGGGDGDAPSVVLIDAARPQDDLSVHRFVASADMVIVLVEEGTTHRRALNETLATIRMLRPRAVGIVVVEA